MHSVSCQMDWQAASRYVGASWKYSINAVNFKLHAPCWCEKREDWKSGHTGFQEIRNNIILESEDTQEQSPDSQQGLEGPAVKQWWANTV